MQAIMHARKQHANGSCLEIPCRKNHVNISPVGGKFVLDAGARKYINHSSFM